MANKTCAKIFKLQIYKHSKASFTLLCVDEGVTGGVSTAIGDKRPSLLGFEQGNRCSCTLASLNIYNYFFH